MCAEILHTFFKMTETLDLKGFVCVGMIFAYIESERTQIREEGG
ncbi:hypothetical protein SAMN05421807_12147 [Virgibacillus chiguensis]|uniref:Uncharacterized protein n=1 Tax=Virgibacillus chiguensis TaxID=411959 RepID=A0A1M5X5A3_9BACI|nr:hypothetical protein SAMN05421807_12147 [Virgibacillus chiguensis]